MKDINEYKDENHDVLTYKGKDYLITKKISYLLRDKIGNTNLPFYVYYPKFVYDCIDSFNMGVYSGSLNDEMFIKNILSRCEHAKFFEEKCDINSPMAINERKAISEAVYTLENYMEWFNNSNNKTHTISGVYFYSQTRNYILKISYDFKTGITRIYDDTVYPRRYKKKN